MTILRRATLTTAATFDALTSDEAKKHLEIASSVTVHDTQIATLIDAATEILQADTGFILCASTWTYKLGGWPCEYIELPVRPVSSITSIVYLDQAGASQTWSSTNYTFASDAVIPTIHPAYGISWPSLYGSEADVTITLVAGYASAAAVPLLLKQLLLLKIAHLFIDREGLKGNEFDMAYNRLLMRAIRSTYP